MRYQGSDGSPRLSPAAARGGGASPRDELLPQRWQMLWAMGSGVPAAGRQQGKADPIRRQGSVTLRSALLAEPSQAPWLGLEFPLEGERHHQSVTGPFKPLEQQLDGVACAGFSIQGTTLINTRSAALEIKAASPD